MLRRLLLALLFAPPHGAGAQPQLPPAAAWQLESYRVAAAGLRREEACRALSSDERREFAWHLERIEAGLAQEWGLEALSGAIGEIAAAPEPVCAADDAERGRAALDEARDFTALLRGLAFSPDALRLADAERLVRLGLLRRVDDRCRVLPEEPRRRLDADLGALGRRFAAEVDAAALAQLERSADLLSAQLEGDRPAIDCAELAAPGVERTLAEASRAAAR